jgi:hypothetical protein
MYRLSYVLILSINVQSDFELAYTTVPSLDKAVPIPARKPLFALE